MNDALTGFSPYSLWSGLNEVTRAKASVIGSEISPYGIGGYNGLTNIYATPGQARPGKRFSVLTNSALYRMRVMGTWAVPENDKGWSYAVSASARLGGNDWVQGVYYRSFAYYLGVEKNWNDRHRLALVTFGAPGQRGAQNASTQEVYDLMGDNMYNSNWGYQNGKMRNARGLPFASIIFLLFFARSLPCGESRDFWVAYSGFLFRSAHSLRTVWRDLAMARAWAGISSVMTEPAPI